MHERGDINRARAEMSPSIAHWRDLHTVRKVVAETEPVRKIAGGLHAPHTGLLVLTDRRVFFVAARHLRWTARLGQIRGLRCEYNDVFATVILETDEQSFAVRYVDSRDAVALVTAANGECRRVPKSVAIAG